MQIYTDQRTFGIPLLAIFSVVKSALGAPTVFEDSEVTEVLKSHLLVVVEIDFYEFKSQYFCTGTSRDSL